MHDVLWSYLIHAHILQNVKKVCIILTIHLLKLNLYESHALNGIRLIKEEVFRVIQVFQQIFFWSLPYDRRQLEHVANKNHLLTSEWSVVSESLAHGIVDSIHHITFYH